MEIWKQVYDTKYEVSNFGNVRKKCKKKYIPIHSYWHGKIKVIKIPRGNKNRNTNLGKLIATLFIRELKPNEVIFHKNGIKGDNRLDNLEIITRTELGKRTGHLSKMKPILLIKDGEIEKIYKGTREAAEDLYISRQTVSDYCNKKVRNPMYNLIWSKDLGEV